MCPGGANMTGTFRTAPATFQSMYAPGAHGVLGGAGDQGGVGTIRASSRISLSAVIARSRAPCSTGSAA